MMEKRNHKEVQSPFHNENLNACLKEIDMVNRCMIHNNHNKDMCSKQMDNYSECKKFWNRVEFDRMRNGIWPRLPMPEDRERIRLEYMNKNKES